MKRVSQIGLGAFVALTTLSSNVFAAGNIVLPTVDYTDFYAGVGLALGITLTVMLARKVKSFISK